MSGFALELDQVLGRTDLGDVSRDGEPLSFGVRPGEIGVVLGGKETSALLRLILGLGTVARGEIRLADGRSFRAGTREEELNHYRAGIGFGYRDKGLLSNLSVQDNVDLPAKYHGHYRRFPDLGPGALAAKALEDLDVPRELWANRPSRVNNEIRKRVLFARAIVLDPAVLVLDDPPEFIASEALPRLMRWILAQKSKGRALLIGTNNWPVGVALADWVLHPRTGTPVTEYADFVDPAWTKSATLLKERMERP
jgi:ABC-type transporter Mla maintaining outer membrane lipid asymmetry ATPase subunit MlaF